MYVMPELSNRVTPLMWLQLGTSKWFSTVMEVPLRLATTTYSLKLPLMARSNLVLSPLA